MFSQMHDTFKFALIKLELKYQELDVSPGKTRQIYGMYIPGELLF